MDPLEILLREARIIPELTDLLADDQSCYLVGGALRNVRLGLKADDFDFAFAEDPTALAREFAARLGGHWFFLDEARRQSRVVVRMAGGTVSYDFAPWRADTLEGDLRLRDYTINAMALPLRRGDRILSVPVDPLGGCDDLAARRLRCCSPTVLRDDPLRVLKGVRHALILGLHPDEDTLGKMVEAAPQLVSVAPERIRAELGQIFAADISGGAFDLFDRLDLPQVLFGEPGPRGGFKAGTEYLQRAQTWLDQLTVFDRQGHLARTFDEIVEEFWSRRALLKLAAFLCGYRPADVAALARERLRLGRRASALLKALTDLPPYRYEDIDRLPATKRARALWIETLGPGRGEPLILLMVRSGASPAVEGANIVKLLVDYLEVADPQGRIANLVSGDWVREELRVADGRRIGELLERLRAAEIEGRVSGIDDARRFLRELQSK